MSIFENFFEKFFGIRRNEQSPNGGNEDYRQYGDRFRNPIWQGDDDEDDDAAYFRHPGSEGHFGILSSVFSLPFEIQSQVDSTLREFYQEFGSLMGPGFVEGFDGSNPRISELPAPETLRDNFLKPGYQVPALKESGEPKLDTDLDGKYDQQELKAGDLTKIWKDPSALETVQPSTRTPRAFGNFQSSVMTQMLGGPARMERRRVVKDSEGNVETTVTRQFGDKTHTVTTRVDKNGVESKSEDLINLDENELSQFEKNWQPSVATEPKLESPILSNFPWHKYFGYNPKL